MLEGDPVGDCTRSDGRDAMRPRRAPTARWLVLALTCGLVGCGGSPEGSSPSTSATTAPSAAAPVWRIVALGDSETTGEGDTEGVGWVERYARLLRRSLRAQVTVTNLAQNGKTSDELLAQVRSDAATRRALGQATIVLFGIGGADLNAGDDALAAGDCRGTACYAPLLRRFARTFDATVAEVRAIRGPRRTVLRSITAPNPVPGAEDVIPSFVTRRIGLFQARTARSAICRAMRRHGGRCVDLLRAFNGSRGTDDAYRTGLMNHEDCCYPSAKGQQRIAELLANTGLAPVRAAGAIR
jgi:lysophospholipase L1-like esterase